MSFFFKNVKKFSIFFTSVILAVTLTAGSFAVAANGLPDIQPAAADDTVIDMINSGADLDGEPEYADIGMDALPIAEMSFNLPQEMKAAYLVPGSDFLKTKDDSAETVKTQIDDALASVAKYGLNTVIIDTVYGEQVIYNTAGAEPKFPDFDVTEYIASGARENGLYVYAIFDASDYDNVDALDSAVSAFAAKYLLDGILADGYEGAPDSANYAEYIKSGGSVGYDNFLNQRAASIAKTVSQAVRKSAPDTQAGILVNPVWENASANADGTNTTAEYTSLSSGYADTKRYIELGWFDLVAVKASTSLRDEDAPFSEIAAWWSKLAEKKSIPMYIVYPTSKVGSNGWTSSAISDQATFAANENSYRGAIYDSLKNIPGSTEVMAAVSPSAELALTPVSSTTNAADIVKPVATQPTAPAAEAAPATPKAEPEAEPEISSDEELWEDSEDYYDYDDYEDYDYEDYGYEDSEWDYSDDEEYEWLSELLGDDAHLSVSSSGSTKYAVEIKVDQTPTYPTSTKSLIPSPTMYPLPKGAVDYTNGKIVSFTSGGVKHQHLILSSGYRVDSKNVKKVDEGPKNNSITGLSLSNKSGYTYLTLKTKQKVTYAIKYTGKEFIIKFDNTTSVPNASTLSSNPMFSKATWSKNTLTLTLAKTGGFMGYKGYYDGNDLVFRFNNPPSSLKNAKIYVDPGHGGTDVGAIGRNPTVYEKDITPAIAKQVVAELESRGATVMMYDQKKNIRGPARVAEAEAWGADLIVSIHCNTAANTAAKGTEVYYFYPFARQLAANTSLNASKQFGSTNRGAKSGIFHVTLSSEVPGVLVETGFMTNTSDYAKLLKSSYHKKLAVGIANGVEGAIKTAYTGTASNGTEFKSPGTAASGSDIGTSSGSSNSRVTSVSFSESTMEIRIGESITLKPQYTPSSLKNVPFTWRSSSSSTVSVDENGRITGVKAGYATITATADDGSKQKATIRINVTNEVLTSQPEIDVSGIALTSASDPYMPDDYVVIYPNNKYRVEVLSEDGRVIRGADFTWKSDDTKVASVDSHGVVTAKSTGDTIITATGGGYTMTCEVEVSRNKVAVKGVSLSEDNLTLVRGATKALYATIRPANAADQDIAWSTSDAKIATVNARGVITAKATGKVTITAKTKSGGFTATCKVEVVAKAVALEEITAIFPEFEMRVGSYNTMDIEFYPENTTTDISLTYTSSNPNVVSVDSEGNLTAVSKGIATVTAVSKTNSRLRATSKITVIE